jgi:hypothetical protein
VFSILRAIDGRESSTVPARAIYGKGADPTPELEAAFFAGIQLPNGTFKTTGDHRLDDLNDCIALHLPVGRVRAKDVAVSSGITTLEWYESLIGRGFTCEMTATDIDISARLVACRGELVVLTSASGDVMQVDISGFAFRPDQAGRRERLLYGVPLQIAARAALRDRLTRTVQDIDLVSPRLSRNPDVHIVEEDLTRGPAGEWDVVRAANILNLGYFPEDVLELMVTNIARMVREAGLVAICRTVPTSGNHASLFRRTDGRLEPIDDLGSGSEIAHVARRVSL